MGFGYRLRSRLRVLDVVEEYGSRSEDGVGSEANGESAVELVASSSTILC
jgi:hypothetical protein